MQNIYESVSKLYDDIVNETDFYKHRNLIITGSNAIGKTQLIKDILKIFLIKIRIFVKTFSEVY